MPVISGTGGPKFLESSWNLGPFHGFLLNFYVGPTFETANPPRIACCPLIQVRGYPLIGERNIKCAEGVHILTDSICYIDQNFMRNPNLVLISPESLFSQNGGPLNGWCKICFLCSRPIFKLYLLLGGFMDFNEILFTIFRRKFPTKVYGQNFFN